MAPLIFNLTAGAGNAPVKPELCLAPSTHLSLCLRLLVSLSLYISSSLWLSPCLSLSLSLSSRHLSLSLSQPVLLSISDSALSFVLLSLYIHPFFSFLLPFCLFQSLLGRKFTFPKDPLRQKLWVTFFGLWNGVLKTASLSCFGNKVSADGFENTSALLPHEVKRCGHLKVGSFLISVLQLQMMLLRRLYIDSRRILSEFYSFSVLRLYINLAFAQTQEIEFKKIGTLSVMQSYVRNGFRIHIPSPSFDCLQLSIAVCDVSHVCEALRPMIASSQRRVVQTQLWPPAKDCSRFRLAYEAT